RSALEFLDFFGEHGNCFEQITDDSIVSDVKDGSFRILVDRDDRLRVLHADQVLNRAGDANRDVELWCDCLARRSDLTIDRQPFSVADWARRREIAAQGFGEFLSQSEIVFALNPSTDGDDDVSLA